MKTVFAMEWLLHVHVCSLGQRSSIVICKAVIADRSGIAASQSGSRRRYGEPRLCDWCGLRSFALKRVLHCKVEFRRADCSGMAASCDV